MLTIALIVTIVIAVIFAVMAMIFRSERDDALDLNEELLSQISMADVNIAYLERDVDTEKEKRRRVYNNYQSMKTKKIKYEKFLINSEKGDREKIDALLKNVMSKNKYLKAKQNRNEQNASTNK